MRGTWLNQAVMVVDPVQHGCDDDHVETLRRNIWGRFSSTTPEALLAGGAVMARSDISCADGGLGDLRYTVLYDLTT